MKRPGPILSLLLLVVSPAVGGTVLPVLHPCPVDAPWQAQVSEHAGHHDHHQAPASDRTSHDCTCISNCSAGPAAPVLAQSDRLAFQAGTIALAPSGADARLVLAPITELLPPATAPPAYPTLL